MDKHFYKPFKFGLCIACCMLVAGCASTGLEPATASLTDRFETIDYAGDMKFAVESYLTSNHPDVTLVESAAAVSAPSGNVLVCGDLQANGGRQAYVVELDPEGAVRVGSVARTTEEALELRQLCADNNIPVSG